MNFLEWLVVGLIAGWLAGKVMKGGGYGLFADLILGILGGILGGWIFGMLGIWPGGGIIGSLLVAFIGAVDRKSTRLNSSHPSNLVCRLLLEKKKKKKKQHTAE